MSDPSATQRSFLARAASTSGTLLKKATIVGDINPLQNREFCKAMSVHLGSLGTDHINDDNRHYYEALEAYGHELPEDGLSERAQPVYHVLAAMRSILEEHDRIIKEFEPELGAALKQLLEKQGSLVATDLDRYVDDVSPEWRSFWLVVAYGSVAWQLSLVKGPDPAFIPLRVPVLIRTAAIFSDWILHPTANRKQLADIFTQRLLTAAPQQILYTIAMITALDGSAGVYKEGWYQPLNLGLSLGAVLAVIVGAEMSEYGTRRKVAAGVKKLAIQEGESDRMAELRRRLTENAGKMEVAQTWAKGVRAKHAISPAENNAFGALMVHVNEFVATQRQLAQAPQSTENPERAEKLQPLYVCTAFSVLQIVAASRSKISLGMAVSWSEYALYRLVKHVRSPSRTAEETWKLLDQVGGIVPAQLLLHSLPMAIDSDAFKRQWLVNFSTTLLSFLQTTVSHKTGPMVSGGSKYVIRKSKDGGRAAREWAGKLPFRRLAKLLRFMVESQAEVEEEELADRSTSAARPLLWEVVREWEGGEDDLWGWLKGMEEKEAALDEEFSTTIWEVDDEEDIPADLHVSKDQEDELEGGEGPFFMMDELVGMIDDFIEEMADGHK